MLTPSGAVVGAYAVRATFCWRSRGGFCQVASGQRDSLTGSAKYCQISRVAFLLAVLSLTAMFPLRDYAHVTHILAALMKNVPTACVLMQSVAMAATTDDNVESRALLRRLAKSVRNWTGEPESACFQACLPFILLAVACSVAHSLVSFSQNWHSLYRVRIRRESEPGNAAQESSRSELRVSSKRANACHVWSRLNIN